MPLPSHRGCAAHCGWLASLAASVLLLAGCVSADRPRHLDAQTWRNAQQMVLVVAPNWQATTAKLRTYQRDGAMWREVGTAAPVVLGRGGSGWGLGLNTTHPADGPVKREGDGRSPAGVFAIGPAFGYAANVATALDYEAMSSTDWCVDVSSSPYYNRIVDAAKVGDAAVKGASEHMRLDLANHGDQRYRLGFVIQHNQQQQAQGGSCIFAHLWNGPDSTTTGCTAMADATMARLVAWLDPTRHPVFVLLPAAEYQTLQATWHLPVVEGAR